jgi:hypothetical protein
LKRDGKKMMISGAGPWKDLLVTDISTGEVLASAKFYKNDFTADVWQNPKYKQYVDAIVEATYTISHTPDVVSTEPDEDEVDDVQDETNAA